MYKSAERVIQNIKLDTIYYVLFFFTSPYSQVFVTQSYYLFYYKQDTQLKAILSREPASKLRPNPTQSVSWSDRQFQQADGDLLRLYEPLR